MNKILIFVVVIAAIGLLLVAFLKKPNTPKPVVDNTNKDIVTEEPIKNLEKFTIDTEKSEVAWSGKMVLINKIHNGTIKVKEGRLDFDGANLVGGRFVLDMATIADNDQKGDMKDKLETHLKSADFFDVANNPVSELIIKSVSASSTPSASSTASTTSTADMFTISADLTIKGITNSIEFPAKIVKTGNMVETIAEIRIDRSLWGVKYGSGKFFSDLGDKAIADEIVYNIKLVGVSDAPIAEAPTATSTPTSSPENITVNAQGATIKVEASPTQK
ncbi:MAG: YceI family protein [Candidatus Falkowbacteria bacterium]